MIKIYTFTIGMLLCRSMYLHVFILQTNSLCSWILHLCVTPSHLPLFYSLFPYCHEIKKWYSPLEPPLFQRCRSSVVPLRAPTDDVTYIAYVTLQLLTDLNCYVFVCYFMTVECMRSVFKNVGKIL